MSRRKQAGEEDRLKRVEIAIQVPSIGESEPRKASLRIDTDRTPPRIIFSVDAGHWSQASLVAETSDAIEAMLDVLETFAWQIRRHL